MCRLEQPQALDSFRAERQKERREWPMRITLSGGTCGEASGSLEVLKALQESLQEHGLSDDVHVRVTGCQGFCQQEPLLMVEPLGVLYCNVAAGDAAEIVTESVIEGRVIERLCYLDLETGERVQTPEEVPFFAKQDRELIGRNRYIDPFDVGDYIACGGYSALTQVLTSMDPEDVIGAIKSAGLRGRGGGGYPTARKWEQCRQAPGDERYVICNADEGDPGAYMDRGLLEGNPHSIIEGMLIGAYAVGARRGYIYVRNEYPLAVTHTRRAIEQARDLGLLGEDILGTGFSFDVKVARGGGAFVCGESTALMASLEGEVGEPRAKDVHTVERGYLDQPTVLNNVETWANVPGIISKGAAWFAAKGTDKSKGTKIFALTGHVKNTGLVEVQMGTTLRDIVLRHWRRRSGRKGHQGGADRRTVRRLRACVAVRPAGRLRSPGCGRLDDGLRRHGGHGRVGLHGGRRQVLPQVPVRRVVRQVRALPAGHRPHAGDPHRHQRRPGPHGADRHAA